MVSFLLKCQQRVNYFIACRPNGKRNLNRRSPFPSLHSLHVRTRRGVVRSSSSNLGGNEPYKLQMKYVLECFSRCGIRKMSDIIFASLQPSLQRIVNKGSSLILMYITITVSITAADHVSDFLSIAFGLQGFHN